MRESVSRHKDLAGKLTELENRYDRQFKVVFDRGECAFIPLKPPSAAAIAARSWLPDWVNFR